MRPAFWDEYDKILAARRAAEAEKDAEAPEFELLETKIPLGELPSTPKRVLRKAREAGFTTEGYEARVRYRDTFYATGDRKGEPKKAAFEQRNIFLGGIYRNGPLVVKFYATWLGSKFSAHIYDPVGRFRYANTQAADTRETYWLEKSSRAFEQWLGEWGTQIWRMNNKKEAVND